MTTRVSENPADRVSRDGEVVTGVGVPETVRISPVRESKCACAHINGVPVAIDPTDRSIAHVMHRRMHFCDE